MKQHKTRTATTVHFSSFTFKGKVSEMPKVEKRLLSDALYLAGDDGDDDELFETLFDLYRARAIKRLANQSVVQNFRIVRKQRKRVILA